MKTFASESYTIAWFKIADFVSRGEKERALHMYPLLMHSISEPAISYQLEGDILLAFDDMAALECYRKAVELYKKSGKLRQAIGVYEHASLFVQDEKILKGEEGEAIDKKEKGRQGFSPSGEFKPISALDFTGMIKPASLSI